MSQPAALRSLPGVDELAGDTVLTALEAPAALRVRAAREAIDEERSRRLAGAEPRPARDLAATAAAWLRRRLHPGPRRVLNATGTVVHTNLGRAPLSAEARAALGEAAGYCDLEFDLAAGTRGSRQDHVAPLLASLCDAEDALVVCNNAAAVLLTLRTLCRGREVLVSRGEAVEIGGGFRIPEVMRESGARLVDVGTTNRTRAADFAAAITPRTAAVMRVHASNFAMRGFVETPAAIELAALAHRHGLLLLVDAGSGVLTDPTTVDARLDGETPMAAAIGAGADLVMGSGDKLCGGPQAGLIAGRGELVARLRRHPLLRALRPDKLVLAALGATLAAHLSGEAATTVPVLRMLGRLLPDLDATARAWAARLRAAGVPAEIAGATGPPGGGSLPGVELPTVSVVLPGPSGRLLAALRSGTPAVVARAEGGRVWLDPRTVAPDEAEELVAAVITAWGSVHGSPARP
ncbi:MAG TPA: L-seryl-tRNA(Sec) selenium transferase [Candidatus Dormibacteraeota bacterium]